MKKCILHICNYAAAYKGNFFESLLALENYLKNSDIEQIYILPSKAKKTHAINWIEELRKSGHKIYIQSDSFKYNIKLFLKIKKEHNIVKVFRHFADNKTDILTKLFFKGKNTVHFFHGEYKTPVDSPKHIMRKFLYKDNLLVGVSDAVSERLRKVFPGNKTITITNAICFSRLDSPCKHDFGEGVSCMTMGYNPIVKGCDLAIKAVEKLWEKYNVTLYIVAASHLEDIKEIIAHSVGKMPSWVRILPPEENVSTYFSNVDILLAPSRSEGFSYACVEATYCGASVVYSDVDAHKLLKINKEYMFKSEDIDDFALNLEKAINNLEADKTKKAKYKEKVIAEYSLDSWCKEIVKAIG